MRICHVGMPRFALTVSFVFGLARAASAPGPLSNLVTFGDSYTDVVQVGDGGVAWPVYAVGYANATLYPFAKSGAVCSQDLTPRPFPGVVQDELPAYFAGVNNGSISAPPDKTLYTIWIGTNDLGPTTLLLNEDVKNNATIVNVTACAVGWVQTLYESGARNFLLQNVCYQKLFLAIVHWQNLALTSGSDNSLSS